MNGEALSLHQIRKLVPGSGWTFTLQQLRCMTIWKRTAFVLTHIEDMNHPEATDAPLLARARVAMRLSRD